MNLGITPIVMRLRQNNTADRQNNNYNSYTNLQPLKKDTVNFTGGAKIMSEYTGGININLAKHLREEALPAMKELQKELDSCLSPLKATLENPDRPIAKITTRLKEDYSICEKTTARQLRSKSEVKDDLQDIIGARIVMRDSSRKNVDEVIKRLIESVKSNKIKIYEIENYRPDAKYDYASPKMLKKLRDAGNKVRSNGVTLKEGESIPSGYMAIHFSTFLPNGFKGEIQLMGIDVERVKEIEDFIYKLKNNKSLKEKYKPIEDRLSELKTNKVLQKAVTVYTQDLYKAAREKAPRKLGAKDPKF